MPSDLLLIMKDKFRKLVVPEVLKIQNEIVVLLKKILWAPLAAGFQARTLAFEISATFSPSKMN